MIVLTYGLIFFILCLVIVWRLTHSFYVPEELTLLNVERNSKNFYEIDNISISDGTALCIWINTDILNASEFWSIYGKIHENPKIITNSISLATKLCSKKYLVVALITNTNLIKKIVNVFDKYELLDHNFQLEFEIISPADMNNKFDLVLNILNSIDETDELIIGGGLVKINEMIVYHKNTILKTPDFSPPDPDFATIIPNGMTEIFPEITSEISENNDYLIIKITQNISTYLTMMIYNQSLLRKSVYSTLKQISPTCLKYQNRYNDDRLFSLVTTSGNEFIEKLYIDPISGVAPVFETVLTVRFFI